MKGIFVIITDLFIVYMSILLGFQLLEGNVWQGYLHSPQAFIIITPIIGILYVFFAHIFELYNSSRQRLSEAIYTVCLICLSFTAGIMALCFLVRNGEFAYPRNVLLVSMLIYTPALVLWHFAEWKMTKASHGIKDIVVIGKSGATLAKHINSGHNDIYRVKYICDENDPMLWSKIDEVSRVFLTSKISEQLRNKIFYYATEKDILVYFVPKYSDIGIIHAELRKIDDIPTFRISKTKLTFEEEFVKRIFDVVLTSIALAILSPIFLLVLILTKLDGGPAFYSQDRLTKGGKIFKVLKFRSMVPNAEKLSGPTLAGEDDPRITRVGRFLRATRLDELPQLINIINGEMSIVGPRPERPFFVDQFEQDIPEYHSRLKVKAGLTGLAQIMGKYNTHVTQKLRYDLLYINQYSPFRDIIIMLQTVKILFMKSSTEGVAATSPQSESKLEDSKVELQRQ